MTEEPTSPAISVLYVTKRMGGFDLLFENLKRQRFRDFELVIVDELYEERRAALSFYLSQWALDFPVYHLPVIGYEHKRLATICRAYNLGYANCRGELVVVLQDYVYVNEYGLEKFWQAYEATAGKKFLTGCSTRVEGHPVENPHGLLTTYNHWCSHCPPGQVLYFETRPMPREPLASITSEAWEANWAAVPRHIVEQLRGIDEDYDFGPASYDNQNLSQRGELLGYETTLLPDNVAVGANHYAYFDDRPGARVTPNQSNMLRHFQRMQDIASGMEPLVKADYLAPWRGMRAKYGQYEPGGRYRA